MRKPTQCQRNFITYLKSFVPLAERGSDDTGQERHDGRAALAILRREIGKDPGTIYETHRYVAPWLDCEAKSRQSLAQHIWNEDAYYTVASLFAGHRKDIWPGFDQTTFENFGVSFGYLRDTLNAGNQERDRTRLSSMDRRFISLLNSHEKELRSHLQHAVSLLKSHEIRINWAQLLVDIQDWDNDDRSVQRAWAQAYWGGGRVAIEDDRESARTEPGAGPVATGQ